MSDKSFSALSAARLGLHPLDASQVSGVSSPRLCDLSVARLERKQGAKPAETRSCDNLLTAYKVQKVARDWTLMKKEHESPKAQIAPQTFTSDSLPASPSNRLVSVLKASSSPLTTSSARSLSVAPASKMLYRQRVSSPPRTATPHQGSDSLLSKFLQASGRLAKLSSPEARKPGGRSRPIIEVSLVPSSKARGAGAKETVKVARRRPRVIEISMQRS